MSVRSELQRIHDEHQELTPALVVQEATDPSNPLHDRFEWNDTVAGQRYREDQARHLIKSVKIEFTTGPRASPRDVRAFVSRGDDTARYVPVEELRNDEVLAAITLRRMEREWKQLKARYGHLQAFLTLVADDIAS